MTEKVESRADDTRRSLLFCYLVIAAVMVFTYRLVPHGHFQTEMDLVRANAARTMADWLPHISETAMLINAPALAASETLLPGVWLYHVACNKLFGGDPSLQLFMAVILHMLAAWSIASLAVILTKDRRAMWAGLVFAVHPVLGDLSATYTNGPVLLAFLWLMQAALCYSRFVLRGAFGQLIATLLCVFLSASTDRIGYSSILLIAGIEAVLRSRGAPLALPWRIASVFLAASSALAFIVVLRISKVPAGPLPTLAGLSVGSLLRGGVYALKGIAFPNIAGKFGHIVGPLAGTAILFGGVYRALEDGRRLMPVALFAVAVVLSAASFTDPSFSDPDLGAAFLFPVLLVSLVFGDFFTAVNNRRVLGLLLAALTGYMSTAAALRLQVPVARGRQVEQLGDELHRLYADLRDEADIYLIDDGVDRSPLLAAHLDFVYRYGLSHQTRISLVVGGMLFADGANSPVGQIGRMMRLERTARMAFIGWKTRHEGLTVLNEAIDGKLSEADEMMRRTEKYVDPLPMGGIDAIENWKPAPGEHEIGRDGANDIRWFLEAPIIRLHPIIGRRGYALGLLSEE